MIDGNSRILYPQWQHEYQAAIVELNHKDLSARVMAAETAIFTCLQSISQSSHYQAERQAIEDALASLRVLEEGQARIPRLEKRIVARGVVCAKQATWSQWKGAFIEKLW